MTNVRRCRYEYAAILTIVNAASEAYRGVIPPDCWHDPYMPLSELRHEIAEGVEFWGAEIAGELVGVMGMQPKKDRTPINSRNNKQRPDTISGTPKNHES